MKKKNHVAKKKVKQKRSSEKKNKKKLHDWHWICTKLEFLSLSTHFLFDSLGYVHCIVRV